MEGLEADWVNYFLVNIFIRGLLILVYFGGIALAIVRWKMHPRISFLVLISLSILLVSLLINLGFDFWMFFYLSQMSIDSIEKTMTIKTIVGYISSFVNAVSLIILLVAVFSRRRKNH